MALYKISEIEFDIPSLIKKVEDIGLEFDIYNGLLNSASFDTQILSIQLLKYEARHSNKIEGIETDDIKILSTDTPLSKKISNYISALKIGDDCLESNGLWSVDLILRIHKELFNNMLSMDALSSDPGRLRKKQVKIANHNPPEPSDVEIYVKDLVNWLNDEKIFEGYSPIVTALVKGSIAHAYFEKIHPFIDGNGRTGRIIFNLILNQYKLYNVPYFYISRSILNNQYNYYQELAVLDNKTNFQSWIRFFLSLISDQVKYNINTIKKIEKLIFNAKKSFLTSESKYLRDVQKMILNYITKYPIFTFSAVYTHVKPSYPDLDKMIFVKLFDSAVERHAIEKIKNTPYYQYVKFIDILVNG